MGCFPLKAVATSPVPVIETLAAATDATLRTELVVSVACLPLSAVRRLVFATVNDPQTVVFPVTASVVLKMQGPSDCSSRLATTSRAITSPLHVMPAMDSCVVELIDEAFAAIVVIMSVPLRNSWGTSRLLPIMAEPATSIDGALTRAENRALPAEMPSRSTPLLSAKLRVPDAGFTRAQVS